MRLTNLLLTVFAFGIMLGVFLNQAPYRFSSQAPVDLARLSGYFDPTVNTAFFHGQKVGVPGPATAAAPSTANVLGAATDKRIEVDLTTQRLKAFEGDREVFNFAISSGKWGRTPTGTFKIWTKLRYTKMSGGSKALNTYYYLPNVPFTMYFYNDEIPQSRGFGIHGTYWHNNFGHPMSHGCINMKTDEAGQLYYWANPVLPEGKQSTRATDNNPGTPVIISGTAPAS